MPRRPLPVPDGIGIYGFPDDMLASLDEWQGRLRSRRESGEPGILELVAPLTETRYLIEERAPRGRPVLALEPHHDDLVLSAGGYVLSRTRPLTVVTVFTQTTSVHPGISPGLSSIDEISALRAEESRQAFLPLHVTRHHLLGLNDADAPYQANDPRSVPLLADLLRPCLDEHPDAELIAPAGVTRHPDHLRVHEAARRLGCRWFWDDTSFYPTYAANVDDRHLFDLRVGRILTSEVQDITDVALDKLVLLHMYQSQMQPQREMYRVLRYNWTVAAPLHSDDGVSGNARFAERFFRVAGQGSA
ncbi:MAG TPA: PIG-L family deacetylase [Actinophytocola sp.]|uniref:PIG-L deacetylase family protein n=1 Tax=Actinophytocola sp. TaxID=1872138 RepID=UPI002E0A8437|nr:PIG-L family deacetylase [Actinophytocola sp.]